MYSGCGCGVPVAVCGIGSFCVQSSLLPALLPACENFRWPPNVVLLTTGMSFKGFWVKGFWSLCSKASAAIRVLADRVVYLAYHYLRVVFMSRTDIESKRTVYNLQ